MAQTLDYTGRNPEAQLRILFLLRAICRKYRFPGILVGKENWMWWRWMKRTYQTRNSMEHDITRSLCWQSKERNGKRQSSWRCPQMWPQSRFAKDPSSSTKNNTVLPSQDYSNELYLLNPAVPWKKNIWCTVLKGFVKAFCSQSCLHFAAASDSLGDKFNAQSCASFWRRYNLLSACQVVC